MRKIFSNFEQLPVNLSCKLFDTPLRPILTYNCEIWYMEDYLPIYRALIRADKIIKLVILCHLKIKHHMKKHTQDIVKLSQDLKKCHLIFLLNLNQDIFLSPHLLKLKYLPGMYFIRINSNNINPLIKESLNVNKKNAR